MSYNRLPEIIPTHWGINGEVNGTAQRPMIFLLGSTSLLITVLILLCTKYDMRIKKKNQVKFLDESVVALNLMLFAMMCFNITEAVHPGTVDIGCWASVLIGALFTFLGNLLPKTRQNSVLGVRTKWTLTDKDNWNYTARVSGWCMFLSGLAIIAGAFILPMVAEFVLIMALTAFITVLSCFVSWRFARWKL